MKKILSLILAVLMIAAALAGCGKKASIDDMEIDKNYTAMAERVEAIEEMKDIDKNILVNIEGVPMSEAAVRFAVISACASFDDDAQRKKEIEDFYVLYSALVKEAAELGAEIDDDTFKQQVQGMQVYLKQSFGDNYYSEFENSTYTPYFYYLNTCYNTLFSNIFSKYTEDENAEILKTINENTNKEVAEVLETGDFIRAKHILIKFPDDIEKDADGNIAESAKKETLAKANEVLAKVQAMKEPSEFDELIKEYGEDPGMESYPAGYYFTEGEMVKPFEETAYALKENETSGLVEVESSNYGGYHIIQRLPFDETTYGESNIAQVYNEIYDSHATTETRNIILEKSKDYEIVYADNYEEIYDKYVKEFEEKWKPETENAQTQAEQ